MIDFHLRFYSLRSYERIIDLLAVADFNEIPSEPGAFVFGTNDGTKFIYPWGSSPIFYIGQTEDLRRRFSNHRRRIVEALQDVSAKSWWPRYQFSAAFARDCAWYRVQSGQRPQILAEDLIRDFRGQYGAIPVANASLRSWAMQATLADDQEEN